MDNDNIEDEEFNPLELNNEELEARISNSYNYNSLTYNFFKMMVSLQERGDYKKARELFYDNIQFYKPFFDTTYLYNCQFALDKYYSEKYQNTYTIDQIEQIVFMRHLTEFTKLLFRASTSKHSYQPKSDKNVELVPIGFEVIFDFEGMANNLFHAMMRLKVKSSSSDVRTFFYHTLGWFAGLFDYEFVKSCADIYRKFSNKPLDYENKQHRIYNHHVGEFSELLSRMGVAPTPQSNIIYKPTWDESEIPHSIEDVVKQ